MKKIKFHKIDYNFNEYNAALKVMKSGWLTMGPQSKKLEKIFAKKFNKNHSKSSLAVSSCTTGLHLALISLGVKKGDEVICPSLTFVADANAIKYIGAEPIFCDINSQDDLTISCKDIEKKITKKTKVIIVVHYAGYPANIEKIKKIAKKNKIKILEDSCHALFSKYKKTLLGDFGDLSVFSFYSNKNITSGEGGIIYGNKKYINKIHHLRNHGIIRNNHTQNNFNSIYDVVDIGYNYRLNDISSSIIIQQLKKITNLNKKRKQLAIYYKKKIGSLLKNIHIPFNKLIGGNFSYHIFPIILPKNTNRIKLYKFLSKNGIETTIHYRPINKFSFYKKKINLNNLDEISKRIISLPIYPKLKRSEIDYIISKIILFFKK